MKLSRRHLLQLVSGAAMLPATTHRARALDYPTRPVQLIEGFGAGAAPDIVARLIGQALSERFGQSFVIENHTGWASNIAAEQVARATPDGYTLLLLTTANAINATMFKLNFDLTRDLTPVASICRAPLVDGGAPLGSSQDGGRIHCLCQGQPRQDQSGVSRNRIHNACDRRNVQNYGGP
jgi:tripartite-type tricarboxylate transporter receptor subunit TctC